MREKKLFFIGILKELTKRAGSGSVSGCQRSGPLPRCHGSTTLDLENNKKEKTNLTQEEDEVSMIVMTDAVAGKHAVVFPLQNAHVARAANKYVKRDGSVRFSLTM